ncbi:alginate lyase-domain-containing protein [Mycena floridula]|nr:alginate lyase-domain-containing protein [Mycena floridula]
MLIISSWPNCTGVGNMTELAPEEVWTTCPYYTRDGLFNPDRLLVNDTSSFSDLSDAVLYNAIAWVLTGQPSSVYSKNVASFIRTWFIDPETKMNPSLNFAQLKRGPDGQVGQHTGILDLKTFTKIVTGILILRKGQSPDWTDDVNTQMNAWANEYIPWLETNDIALGERRALNNHGSFYYNQLGALKILVDDLPGATNVTNEYFETRYLAQIAANGEQPFEAVRTRPYHYRAYNLAAMITNARIMVYADPTSKPWNITTTAGATIKSALDYTLTLHDESDQADAAPELFPCVAAVASTYGDLNGKYAALLAESDPDYADDAYFLWNQPLAGGSNSTTKITKNPVVSSASSVGRGIRISLVLLFISSLIHGY